MILPFRDKTFLKATATLVGTMIGVGVFSIPFAFSKTGLWVGMGVFVLAGLATLLINFLYSEVILRTSQAHQLVGYADIYAGRWAKRVVFLSLILSTYAALLSYIIVGGEFWANVVSSFWYGSSEIVSIVFFVAASLLVLAGIKTISSLELGLTATFAVIIVLIIIFGVGHINFANYQYTNSGSWFFPYGIFLFAFSGMAAIPIQRRILGGKANLFKKSIITAIIFVALLYVLFGLIVLGVTGKSTSPEAISGLVDILGSKIIFIGSLFGALAVSTSYLMLGTSLAEIFQLDYGWHRFSAWLLVIVPPLVLFLGGVRDFVNIIGLAGSLAIGIESAMVIVIFMRAKKHGDRQPEFSFSLPSWFLYLVSVLFVAGAVMAFIFN